MDEITAFCSFYFEDGSHTTFPRPPTVYMGNLKGTMKCLPIFSHPSNCVGKYIQFHRIEQIELHITHTYVLLNCLEVILYVQRY